VATERGAEAERRRQAGFDRRTKAISEAAAGWQTSNRVRDFSRAFSKASAKSGRRTNAGTLGALRDGARAKISEILWLRLASRIA